MDNALFRQLEAMPRAELVAFSEKNIVRSFMVGFDVNGRLVLWKFWFESGTVERFFVAASVAIHFTKATRRAARKYKWTATKFDPPGLVDSDWEAQGASAVGAYRGDAQEGGVILALPSGTGNNLFQALRLSPGLALHLADTQWDGIRSGKLREH